MIGSGNGFMAIHLEPITRTNDDLLSITPLIWIGNAYVAVAEKNWNICIYSLLIYTT